MKYKIVLLITILLLTNTYSQYALKNISELPYSQNRDKLEFIQSVAHNIQSQFVIDSELSLKKPWYFFTKLGIYGRINSPPPNIMNRTIMIIIMKRLNMMK